MELSEGAAVERSWFWAAYSERLMEFLPKNLLKPPARRTMAARSSIILISFCFSEEFILIPISEHIFHIIIAQQGKTL